MEEQPFIWCVVANVRSDPSPGLRVGTRHFADMAKVYCYPALWGDGGERLRVAGKHRGGNRWITVVLPTERLANWRAKKVFVPAMVEELGRSWDDSEASKLRAEEMAAAFLGR